MQRKTRRNIRICLVALTLTLAMPAVSRADTLVPGDTLLEWDIANSRGNTADVLYSARGVSGSSIGSHGVKTWNKNWGYKGFLAATHWEKKDKPHKNKYFQFDVSADDGLSIDYESVSFSLFRGDYSRGRHGAEIWSLKASTDGFKHDILDLAMLDISESGKDEQIFFDQLDISDLGRKAGTVSFRLYGASDNYNRDYSGLGNTNQKGFSGTGSNLKVTGNVSSNDAIPEPATLAVLGLGGMTVLLRRRKTC
jgi:hypothetical protein